jgi:hypothetical protein
MPSSRIRRRLACALLLATALSARPALAADRPATPEGAQKLQALLAKYLPAAVAGAPSPVAVTPEGADYLVSVDLTSLIGMIASMGVSVSYDAATIVYRAVEQDDGKWRVVLDSMPKVISRSKESTSSTEITNYKQTALFDPAIASFVSGSASADKGVYKIQSPVLDEIFDFGPFHSDFTTTGNADSSLSTAAKSDIADIGFKATSRENVGAPVNVSGRLERAMISVGLDGVKNQKVLELWGLWAAHPSRAELAPHEAELKGALKELAAPGLKLVEGGEAQKAVIELQVGAVALSSLQGQLGIANEGPQSSISLHLSADGLSLPVGLAPPGAADLTPSKLDLAATLKGIDIAAGANEAIADLRLQGDGPLISDEDTAKVGAALLSAGPIRIEFARSHVIAAAIDADFEGVVRYALGKPSAAVTIHMRNFDKTMAAIRSLGPDAEVKATPALAMAKGLAKTESDGSLTWLIELGEDRSMKVNGIPLGKAPN